MVQAVPPHALARRVYDTNCVAQTSIFEEVRVRRVRRSAVDHSSLLPPSVASDDVSLDSEDSAGCLAQSSWTLRTMVDLSEMWLA